MIWALACALPKWSEEPENSRTAGIATGHVRPVEPKTFLHDPYENPDRAPDPNRRHPVYSKISLRLLDRSCPAEALRFLLLVFRPKLQGIIAPEIVSRRLS